MQSRAVLVSLIIWPLASSGGEPCSREDQRPVTEIRLAIHSDPELACTSSTPVEEYLRALSAALVANWREPTRWGVPPQIAFKVSFDSKGQLDEIAVLGNPRTPQYLCASHLALGAQPQAPPAAASCLRDHTIVADLLIPWNTDAVVRAQDEVVVPESVVSFDSEDLNGLEVHDVEETPWWQFWKD